MLSIIVAVHNQLGHNQLFLEGIQRYTTGPYEVTVVDNHLTDGSAEFFEASGCRVIRNDRNLCYPESMNLGSRSARSLIFPQVRTRGTCKRCTRSRFASQRRRFFLWLGQARNGIDGQIPVSDPPSSRGDAAGRASLVAHTRHVYLSRL